MDNEAHPMKAKRLEAILGYEGNRTGAEMVTRFQMLRDYRLLPVSRGRNAEHISVDGIVSGLLAMVADKPGFAAVMTIVLRNLRPVGGVDQSFAKAGTFAQAFRAALEDEDLLKSIKEIRVTADEIYTNCNGRAMIVYDQVGVERIAYYVGHTALSVICPGGEKHFNPREVMGTSPAGGEHPAAPFAAHHARVPRAGTLVEDNGGISNVRRK